MTNKTKTVLYTGCTGNLSQRIWDYKNKTNPESFTARYNINRLVYYEVFENPYDMISREKQIKTGSRAKKISLIKVLNLEFKDLYEEYLD